MLRNAFDRADVRHQFGRNFPGRLLKLFCQMECHGQRQLAEVRLFGLLDDNRHIRCVSHRDVLLKDFLDSLFEEMKHENPSIAAVFPKALIADDGKIATCC